MKNLILLTLILTACGQDDGGDGATSNETPMQSIALDSKKDLPECTAANDKQLAYIRDEEQFYTCEGRDWYSVEISSKAIKGERGDDGEDGQDGITVTTNNWYDAVTDKTWLIGAIGSFATAETTCISPWRMPTKDEALAAAQRGLGIASASISGPTTIWTSDVWDLNPTHNFIIQAIDVSPATNGAQRANDNRGVFCIEE